MINIKKLLVVAAHPDDEVLGCGGTIARLVKSGANVHVAFLADGVSSRSGGSQITSTHVTDRRTAARNACQILGVDSISFGEYPDNQMDAIPTLDIAQTVEALIDEHKPDTILTHHLGDVNIDHRQAHEGVVIACRPQSGLSVRSILTFEVPSSTEWQLAGHPHPFVPAIFFDISSFVDLKLNALRAYAEEVRDWPHPRSINGVIHLQSWRGAMVGFNAAEAFSVGRQIIGESEL